MSVAGYPVCCRECGTLLGYTSLSPEVQVLLAAHGRWSPVCWRDFRLGRLRVIEGGRA